MIGNNLEIKSYPMDFCLQSPNMMKLLRKLSLGGYSGMNVALDRFEKWSKTRSIKARAIIAYVNGVAVGWALNTTEKECSSVYSGKGVCFQVYVEYKHRAKGIGTALLNASEKYAFPEKLRVYDSDSVEFFVKNKNRNIDSVYRDAYCQLPSALC